MENDEEHELGFSFDVLLSLVEHLPIGAIFFSGSGRVLARNSRAKRILERDEWVIPNATGEISLKVDGALAGLSQRAPEAAPELVMCEGRVTGQRIGAVLAPFAGRDQTADGAGENSPSRARFALLMWDPDLIGEFVETRFAKAYGLTRAETEVLRSLAESGDILNYCARRKVGVEAARGHLKAAFRKTSCDSRAKLLSLLFQNWAMYGGFAGRNGH